MEIELLNGKLLGNDTIGVAVDGHALGEHLLVGFLDVGFPDRLVADNPCHLFGDIISAGDNNKCCRRTKSGQYGYFLDIHFSIYFLAASALRIFSSSFLLMTTGYLALSSVSHSCSRYF